MKRTICLALGLIPMLASAQGAGSKRGGEILLRFTIFGLEKPAEEYVLSSGEAVGSPFAIPNNGFSEPQAAPGGGRTLALGIPVAPKDAATGKEQPGFLPVSAVKLPDSGKRFLVVVLPIAGKKLRTVAVRADDPAFRPGDVMIFNLARETFAADLGGRRLRFKPASQTIFRPRRTDDLANYQVQFFSGSDGTIRRFAASLWPYFDDKRAFVFLHHDPRTGRPTYRSVDEFTEWMEDS